LATKFDHNRRGRQPKRRIAYPVVLDLAAFPLVPSEGQEVGNAARIAHHSLSIDGDGQDGEPAKSPFDDRVVRERIIQIIVQAAAGRKNSCA
jgi:hypothetical protein